MADPIEGAHHRIGASQSCGQPRPAAMMPAIMVNELAALSLDQYPEMGHLPSDASHTEDTAAVKSWAFFGDRRLAALAALVGEQGLHMCLQGLSLSF